MEQAQHAVAVLDRMVEPVWHQSQMPRDGGQQPVPGRVESGEPLDAGVAKPAGPLGPQLARHVARVFVLFRRIWDPVPTSLAPTPPGILSEPALERGGTTARPR